MLQITRLPTILFYTFLSLIFLFEGLGWRGGREAAFVLLLVMPIFLFALDFILRNKIHIPKIPTILYGGFIFFSTISIVFSVDVGRSFQYLLLYIALYEVFLYVYNHQEEIKKYIIPFIFVFSFILSIYSLFMTYFVENNYVFFIPESGYQLVFPYFGSTNHRGSFLVIPILISFYYLFLNKNKKLLSLVLIFYVPFFIFSYSRSAYLAFFFGLIFLVIFLFHKKQMNISLTKILLTIFFLITSFVLFFATTVEGSEIPIFKQTNTFLQENFNLEQKTFVSKRQHFFSDAIQSIQEKPLWGVGPNNYKSVSEKHSDIPNFGTDTSHNLFVDIYSENGIIAGIFFMGFLGICFIKARKGIFFFVCIAMLINFQTMYTYRIYSFFLLFYILLAINYVSSKVREIK